MTKQARFTSKTEVKASLHLKQNFTESKPPMLHKTQNKASQNLSLNRDLSKPVSETKLSFMLALSSIKTLYLASL